MTRSADRQAVRAIASGRRHRRVMEVNLPSGKVCPCVLIDDPFVPLDPAWPQHDVARPPVLPDGGTHRTLGEHACHQCTIPKARCLPYGRHLPSMDSAHSWHPGITRPLVILACRDHTSRRSASGRVFLEGQLSKSKLDSHGSEPRLGAHLRAVRDRRSLRNRDATRPLDGLTANASAKARVRMAAAESGEAAVARTRPRREKKKKKKPRRFRP